MKLQPDGFMECSICGDSGTSFKNVDEHNLALQSNGYYTCLDCSYKFKSPAIQDSSILTNEDYLYLKGLTLMYGFTQNLRDKGFYDPPNPGYWSFCAVPSLILYHIDQLRSKSAYYNQYDYQNFGTYADEFYSEYDWINSESSWGGADIFTNTNVCDISFGKINDVIELQLHNGVLDGILTILGMIYYPAEWQTVFDLQELVNSPNPSSYDILSAVIGGLDKYKQLERMCDVYDLADTVSSVT